ncbi:MAG: hypothetical protein IPL52_06645 [Flavobacteriales bacterium]|nr:hypothetical protein [Flavobacteriales bacterium]
MNLPSTLLFAFVLFSCTSSTAEHASGAQPAHAYFGKMSYDGLHATLTGCEGQVYWLEGDLFDGVIEEIKKLKADPAFNVWIQVETNEAIAPTNGRPIVLKTGTLGRTEVDPCKK